MKKTKNMIYKESYNAERLYIAFINDGVFYLKHNAGIVENLKKKIKKGCFDKERAALAFMPVINLFIKDLNRRFPEDSEIYTTADKWTTAVDTVNHYFGDYFADYVSISDL